MNYLLTETQMKWVSNILKDLNKNLLNEASKKGVLIKKLGFSESNAELLDRLCGPFSVWMANKLIDYRIDELKRLQRNTFGEIDTQISRPQAVMSMNSMSFVRSKSQSIQSIMDYIRVGLNGDNSSVKNDKFEDLATMAVQWHESLEVGQGEINYAETNKVILDFRNEEGVGYYWVDLQTNDSSEECKRMGHCGRTNSSNSIYSLRETLKIPNTKYTLNKSHLTAAISYGGIIYQLKGPKNSKPQEKYNKYILPLFYVKKDDDYLIQGFGREYQSSNDFKIKDLSDEQVRELYDTRPELFEGRENQRLLKKLGIIETPERNYKFIFHIKPYDVGDYVNGDWVRRRRENQRDIGLFETILSGDMWGMWDNYDADWKSALQYHVDKENERKIKNMLVDMAEKEGVEFDTELDIEEAIEEYDTDDEIKRAISSAVNDSESHSYENYLWTTLKDAVSEYGKLLEFNDSGVELEIDLKDFMKGMDEDFIDECFENCDDNVVCVFGEWVYGGDIEKPTFSIDERWYPDIDNNDFNGILSDRLLEIR